MTQQQRKTLILAKRIALTGIFIGFALFMLGVYESGLIMDYVLSIGLGIMASSMMLFGFGFFLPLMESISGRTPEPAEPVREPAAP